MVLETVPNFRANPTPAVFIQQYLELDPALLPHSRFLLGTVAVNPCIAKVRAVSRRYRLLVAARRSR